MLLRLLLASLLFNIIINQVYAKTEEIKPFIELPMSNNSLVLPVIINKKTYQFLLDTGTSVTVINNRIARQLSTPLTIKSLPYRYQQDFSFVGSTTGKIKAKDSHFLKAQPITIGDQVIKDNGLWLGWNFDLIEQSLGMKIDGILGIDTFRKFNWQVDNRQHKLTIWQDAPAVGDYQQCVPYEDSYNRAPQIYLKYDQSNVIVYFDTGASYSYFGKDFIDFLQHKKVNIRTIALARHGVDAGGHTKDKVYIIENLTFNNMPLGQLRVIENPQELYAVGIDFLQRFQRYIFMSQRMLFCYDANSIKADHQQPLRYIAVRYYQGAIELFYNREHNLAKWHLHNGDRIEKINGVHYQPVNIDKVRDLLAMTPDGQLQLTIIRNGKAQQINL